ncbi:MAG TPA: hypothetical protein VGP68_24170 [Gemmataceae bacterium]|jgi:hypothetical protein|nr:hypothetical protein [Gemmataceae bacterium]
MREFLGLTNENSPYVHLSDGGHFENLGVYELIRRRCRFIIVSDAGVDRLASSDNMAAMLQLIRTDLGVRIDLDTKRMQIGGDQSFSVWHCCVGRIHYDEVDRQGLSGILVYVQATLTGDEPPDLLQYVARHPGFPRQSTVDQFFDETQFEAYRVLGQHTALQVFGEAASSWSGAPACAADHQEEARAVLALLREQWLPPVDCSPAEVLTVAKAALKHDQFLGNQWDLREFSNSLYSEISKLRPGPQRYLDLPEFRAISQTMQIMEMAWSTMKLGSYHAHPINRGWMNTFRRWTSSEAFHRYWSVLRAQYSRPFVSFCEDILNLQPTQTIHTEVPLQSPNDALEKLQKELPELDKQLTQEWAAAFNELDLPMAAFPRQGFLQDFLAQAKKPKDSFPRCWTIHQQAEGSPQAKELICGVACLAATKRQQLLEPSLLASASECELFFWMRGPYRSMGIGRDAVKEILRRIDEESVYMGAAPIRKLVVYYPLRSANSGATMELQRWMDFCFDLGFRRIKQDQRGPSSKIVILKRKVR